MVRAARIALGLTLGMVLLTGIVIAGAPARPVRAFTPASPPPAPSLPDGVLHYTAHWRLLPAATATLAWSETGGLRQIRFTADANPIISLFYPIRDRMTSWYEADSLCTTAVSNDDIEGRRHRQTQIQYHPDQHQLILDETDPATRPPTVKHEVKPIPGCVLDLFTALDYIRAQPLRLGDTYAFAVNEGGRTSQVQARVDLKETVSTPAGRYTCVRVTPTVEDPAALNNPGRMWAWFSDDARHLLVQIEARVSWGTLTAQLTN